jgi:chromosome segregation ATPase
MRGVIARWLSAARCAAGVAALLSGVAVVPAQAQEESREREALRRIQQQFVKLQEENSRLREENARLQATSSETERNLKAAAAEADKQKKETARLRKRSNALRAAEDDNAALTAKLAAADERLKESQRASREQIDGLQNRLTDTRDALQKLHRDSQQTAASFNQSLERETARVTDCENKNAKLYGVTADLINRYKENRGAWEKFLLSEPFTGLKSVEVDNLLEEFRAQASKQRVQSAGPGKPSQ